MSTIIKAFISTVLIAFILLTSGCTKTEPQASQKKHVAVIIKAVNNDFWKTVILGCHSAEKEFGITASFAAPDYEKDYLGQIKLMENAIAKKVDAILLAACDYNELVPVTEKAISQGIKVVVIDSAINTKKISSFIATDNVQAGKIMGRKLADIISHKGNVAIMNFIKNTATGDQREKGFREALANYKKIRIIQKSYSNSREDIAKIRCKKLLEQNKNIDAIAALNGPTTIGVCKAVLEKNLQNRIKIIGFDSTHEEINYLDEGIIAATIVQNPYSMGYLGIKNAWLSIEGKPISPHINTGTTVIDLNNMYTPKNQKLLFPFVD